MLGSRLSHRRVASSRCRCLRDTSPTACEWRTDAGSRARAVPHDRQGAADQSHATNARRRDERTDAAVG